jgi:hypothetical protein
MENFFNGISKFTAVLCAILFVPTVVVTLVFFNIEERLFNERSYLTALERQNFYERLPALAAETLSTSPQEGGVISAIQSVLAIVPTENWEQAMRALLPAEVSRPMTEQTITSILNYLKGNSKSASLSLSEFKAHISGPAGTQAVMDMLRAQPPCTLAQMAEMTVGMLTGNPKLLFCNPSEEMLGLMQPFIQTGLQTAAAGIPDTVTLIRADADMPQSPPSILRTVRGVLRFSPLLPLGLLVLITLLAIRDVKGWLLWWGIPILLGGLLGLAAAGSVGLLTDWAFTNYAVPHFPVSLPDSILELARDLLAAVLAGVSKPIMIQSAALALGGTIMLAVTRHKRFRAA